MAEFPEPLTPPECDLRDFSFMPLDVVRLRDSGLTAKATGDEFRAAVLLWCASWHQVPAASLPDDDDELANICGYSRAKREWAKVRAGAMRGWVRCNDNRLYHAAVAGKALEAWIEKLASAIGGSAGNAKRWGVQIDMTAMKGQFTKAVECLQSIDPQSRTLRKKVVAVLTMPSLPESGGDNPPESPPESPPDRKGQGQGQGQGLTTEPKGSGGDPPGGNPVEKSKAQLWQAAVSLLAGQGMPEVQARTFIGGLKKTYPDEDLVQRAIEAAVGEQPADARAYIKATCQRLSGERSRSGAPDWTATAL